MAYLDIYNIFEGKMKRLSLITNTYLRIKLS